MNSTQSALEASFTITDYYVVCPISGVISVTAVLLSVMILTLVWRTKPRLHTVRHLLMCNTGVASILYCIVQTINYIFLIFIRGDTSDVACRWRGYFAYLTISGVAYSYLIQAISRFFISVLSNKYRWLRTFKTHYILIILQWLTVIIIPAPAILTKDIHFRPVSLCWVPLKHLIHVVYTFVAYYILPTVLIFVIYIFIYYRVRRATNRAETLARSTNNERRNLELLRNILILLCIYLLGGLPSILFLATANKPIYLMSIVCMSLTVAVEKMCAIILDRDIRQVSKGLIIPYIRVAPLNQTAVGRIEVRNRNDTLQT